MLKTMLKTTAAIALAVTPAFAPAQTAPAPAATTQTVQAKPAMWVVKDEDTTIYLFGTIHILKPGISWFDGKVKSAFDESGELVLEVADPTGPETQSAMMKLAIDRGGTPLSQQLPEDKRALYTQVMQANGLPVAQFEQFKPWAVALTLGVLPIMKAGYDLNSGAEQVLLAAAKASGKPVFGLETPEEQLRIFDSLPQPDQVAYLVSILESIDQVVPQIEALVGFWVAGDPDGLGALMNAEMRETATLSKALLGDRNERWATWIDKRMDKPGVVFIAVGAGHLAGPDSVQMKLKAHDLGATRVEY